MVIPALKMYTISLKEHLTKFLSRADAEWDKILPFACYCFNRTCTADDLESLFFLVHCRVPLEGHIGLLCKGNVRYLGDDKGLILFTEIHKLWSAHTKGSARKYTIKNKVKKNKHFKAL